MQLGERTSESNRRQNMATIDYGDAQPEGEEIGKVKSGIGDVLIWDSATDVSTPPDDQNL